jgi:hypothetical protein
MYLYNVLFATINNMYDIDGLKNKEPKFLVLTKNLVRRVFWPQISDTVAETV